MKLINKENNLSSHSDHDLTSLVTPKINSVDVYQV